MEKFRDWADAGTGLNCWPPLYKKPAMPLRVFAILLGPFLSLARLLLFAVLFLVALLSSALLTPLVYIPVLGRLLQRTLEALISRALLFALGVFYIKTLDISKQATRNRAQGKKVSTPPPGGGDLIVCNWTSYADVLYLVYAYSPIFAMLPETQAEGQGEFLVAPMGFCGTVLSSFGHSFPSAVEPLSATVSRGLSTGQPVVVFAEGVRTNGLCVAAMQPFMRGSLAFKGTISFLGVKHEQHFGALPFTAGSAFWHMFHTGRQLYSFFTVRYLDSTCAPPVEDPSTFAQACQHLIVKCVPGSKAVKSALPDKAKFLVFFDTGVKQRMTRVGQGGREIAGEAGLKAAKNKIDAAVAREERLLTKRATIKQEEEEASDSE